MVVTQSKLTLPEDTWWNFGPWCVEPWATTSPHLCDIACCVSRKTRFRSKRMTNLENTQLTQVPLLLYLLPRFNSVLPVLYIIILYSPFSHTHLPLTQIRLLLHFLPRYQPHTSSIFYLVFIHIYLQLIQVLYYYYYILYPALSHAYLQRIRALSWATLHHSR